MSGLRSPAEPPRRASSARAPGATPAVLVAIAIAGAMAGAGAHADCIDEAAAYHQVNAHILRAIGWQESRLNPAAVGRNTNGSTDLGAFQINSIHLAELKHFGVTAQSLANGCVSAYVAAWHYRRQVDRLGNTWAAVGAYHSNTPARSTWYSGRIAAILETWGVSLHAAPPSAEASAARAEPPIPPSQ